MAGGWAGQQPLLHRKWRRWLLLAKPPPGLAHCFPLWETSGGPFPLSPIVPPSPANLGGERHTLAAEPSRPRPQSKKQRQWSDGKKQEGNVDEQKVHLIFVLPSCHIVLFRCLSRKIVEFIRALHNLILKKGVQFLIQKITADLSLLKISSTGGISLGVSRPA